MEACRLAYGPGRQRTLPPVQRCESGPSFVIPPPLGGQTNSIRRWLRIAEGMHHLDAKMVVVQSVESCGRHVSYFPLMGCSHCVVEKPYMYGPRFGMLDVAYEELLVR